MDYPYQQLVTKRQAIAIVVGWNGLAVELQLPLLISPFHPRFLLERQRQN
jgi:hypothetical protein